eukprot:8362454-Pyramimonas_sp.AAC.1
MVLLAPGAVLLLLQQDPVVQALLPARREAGESVHDCQDAPKAWHLFYICHVSVMSSLVIPVVLLTARALPMVVALITPSAVSDLFHEMENAC